VADHTHGIQAGMRNTARQMAKRFSMATGKELYEIQPSRASSKNPGEHEIHWSKDVSITRKKDELTNNHIRTLFDTDFHIPIEEWEERLATYPVTTLIYTFVPETVAGIDRGVKHTFDKDGYLRYTVPGGAFYRHKIFDYGNDTVLTCHETSCTVYHIDRRTIGTNHQMICLTPFAHANGPLSALMRHKFGDRRIRHFDPVRGNYLIMDIVVEGSAQTSIARIGEYSDATIDTTLFERLCNIYRNSKQGPVQGTILSHMPQDKKGRFVDEEYARNCAALLYDYLKDTIQYGRPTVFHPRYEGKYYIFGFTVDEKGIPSDNGPIDHDQPPMMETFMSPLNPNTYVPGSSINSDISGVIGRLETLPVKKTLPSKFSIREMEAFAKEVFDERLQPVTLEEVYDRQSRPTQKLIFEQADLIGGNPPNIASSFTKGETYGEVKPPRLITTEPKAHKIEYARYHYSIMDHLKTKPYYAFGKTPVELEDRIAHIARGAAWAIGQDVSKQDGMQNPQLRVLQQLTAEAAFGPQDAKTLNRLHSKMRNLKVFSKYGLKYFLVWAQASGLMDTSDWNTVNMLFQMFITLRKYGMSVSESISYIEEWYLGGGDDSLLFGDDTIDVEQMLSACNKAAKELGQKMTITVFSRGQPVDFFARWFGPSIWDGQPNSCSDIGRMFSKLVSAPRSELPGVKKLEQKLTALAMTDRQTPGIHEIINRWIEVGGTLEISDPSKWWAQYHSDVQFTNELEDWMVELAIKQGANLEYLIEQLRFINSPEEFLIMEPIFELKPVKPLAVRSVLIDGDESTYLPATADLETQREADSSRLEVYKGKKEAAKLVEDVVKEAKADPEVSPKPSTRTDKTNAPKGKEKDEAEIIEKKTSKRSTNGKATSQPKGKQPAKLTVRTQPPKPNPGRKDAVRKGKPDKPAEKPRTKPMPKPSAPVVDKVATPAGPTTNGNPVKPGRTYKDALQQTSSVGSKTPDTGSGTGTGTTASTAAIATKPPAPSDKQSTSTAGEPDVKTP
jgi:hypothetical protein